MKDFLDNFFDLCREYQVITLNNFGTKNMTLILILNFK